MSETAQEKSDRINAWLQLNKAALTEAAEALGLDKLGLGKYVKTQVLVLNPLTNTFVDKTVAVSEGWFNGDTNQYTNQTPALQVLLTQNQPPLIIPEPAQRSIFITQPYVNINPLGLALGGLGNPISETQTVSVVGDARHHHESQHHTPHARHGYNTVGVVRVHERRYV